MSAAEPYPRRWAGLAVLGASLLVVMMDMTILNVALPELARDVEPTAVELLWIVDIYSLVVAGLLVTASAIGDRLGRRRLLVAGYVAFGAGSLLILLADGAAAIIAIRALLGVGGALIMPSTLAMIRTMFTDPRERGVALGIWASVAGAGAALGPLVGGALLEAFSWQAAFLINVPLMAVAAVAALALLPESRSARPARIDAAGMALSITGMSALVYAIKELGKDGVEPVAVALAAYSLVALGLFVRRCLRSPEPMLDLSLFRERGFTAGTLTALSSMIGIIALLLLGAQWLQLVEGLSPLVAGVALLPVSVGAVVSSLAAPSFAARFGARLCLAGGLVVGGGGLTVLFFAPDPLGYPAFATSMLLVGAASGSLAVASNLIMTAAPADRAGSAAAIEETSYEIGATLSVAIIGSIAAASYRANLPEIASSGARESLAAALEQAGALGPAGQQLAAEATAAFSESLAWAGLAGGVVMLLAAAVVWRLTPAPAEAEVPATAHG